MKKYVRIPVSLLKIKGIYIKYGWSLFKLNRWNIQSIFPWKWIRKNQFFILKRRILNSLGILSIPQNIWLLERSCLSCLKVKVYITKLLSICIIYKKCNALNEVILFAFLHFRAFFWPWKLTFIEHWMNFSSPILFTWWLT